MAESNHPPDPSPPRAGASRAPQAGRFADLRSAGRDLARGLEAFAASEETVVLGIVLGGVPVAFEVARELGLRLDYVIIRRLLVPHGPGSQVCAVSVGGTLVVDEEVLARPAVPETGLDYFIADALAGLRRRERLCRGQRSPMALAHKTVLLVDCGIRTDLTMRAAIRAVRTQRPARVVAAVPVASPEGRATAAAIADDLVCLAEPHPFGHTGLWYTDFRRPGDEQISAQLDQAGPHQP